MKKLTILAAMLALLICAPAAGAYGFYAALEDVAAQLPGRDDTQAELLLDQNGVRISLLSVEHNALQLKFNLFVENDTDKDIYLMNDTFSGDGVMFWAVMYKELAAHEKGYADMSISNYLLETVGMETIGEAKMRFFAAEQDTEGGNLFYSDLITVKTPDFGVEQERNAEGFELVSTEGLRVIAQGFEAGSAVYGTGIAVCVENTTGKDVQVNAVKATVNGKSVSPYLYVNLLPDTVIYDRISFPESELEALGITDIEEIQITFEVYDRENFDSLLEAESAIFQPGITE